MDVEITKQVTERKRLYASTVMFRGSRVFFDNEMAARAFAPWLRSKGMFPFEDKAGFVPGESILDLEIREV